MSPHGQASLRGNLRRRPGLFPFPRVRRDGRDVSALTMDFTHPIAIARIVPSRFDRLSLIFSTLRETLSTRFCHFSFAVANAECQFSVLKLTDRRRTTDGCMN